MAAFKPRNVAIIAGVVCTSIFAFNKMGDFKTPGMKNIENRHSAAGGGHNHTPAGGSKMGSESDTEGRQLGEKAGVGSKYFAEKFGDQKPEPNAVGKKWNQTQHGSDKGLR